MKRINNTVKYLLFTFLLSTNAYSSPSAPLAGMHLAYFIGYHSDFGGYTRVGDPYYTPNLRVKKIVRSTKNNNSNCVRSCTKIDLINFTIKCNTKC